MEHILFAAAEIEELTCAQEAFKKFEKELANKIMVDFMLTGVGTTSTCYQLTKALLKAQASGNPYTLIMDLGIAGSFDLAKFPIGSAAVIAEEHAGNLGFETETGFKTLFDYNVWKPNEHPYTDCALKRSPLPYKHLEKKLNEYPSAVGVTVQTVTCDPLKVTEMRNRFNSEIESMEGSAFYYVALQEHVPFFEIRTVSNAVGESDSKKWDSAAALRSLENCCEDILSCLLKDVQ